MPTITPARVRGRRAPRVLLAAALVACALPATASAAEVTRPFVGQISVTAAPGEANRVRVSDDGTGFVRIRDDLALRESTSVCRAITTFEVRCSVARDEAIVLRQGDRDDRAEVASTVRIGIDGEAGNDTYAGGLGAGGSDVLFRGGTGVDAISYADATARVRVGTGTGAGRTGDSDELAEVEAIVGSRFGDELVGTAAAETFRPGPGDDIVRGGGGADRYESLPTADGADRIFGAGGADIVSYRDRTRRVTATVDTGGADDGDAGERDELVGVAGVRSGSGSDTLRLERTVDAELDGGAGDDTLISAGGRDVLVGGAGVDTLSSGAGVDRVVASDPDRDTIDCGGDSPDEAIVSPGGEGTTTGCERVLVVRTVSNSTLPGSPVGTLRLTPAALDVGAGEVARLRLSWAHPRRWRDLRRIALRLVAAGETVGRIALDPGSRRVRDDRAAARIARDGTRLVRRGRRVSARLALRLDEALAGARLPVQVAAVDVRGRRQVERAAGAIRVLP